MSRSPSRSHKDVDFAIDDPGGRERIFKTWDEACGMAVLRAAAEGRRVEIDVLVHSPDGARWVGGDDAVEQYEEDPEASVFESFVITAHSQGRVP